MNGVIGAGFVTGQKASQLSQGGSTNPSLRVQELDLQTTFLVDVMKAQRRWRGVVSLCGWGCQTQDQSQGQGSAGEGSAPRQGRKSLAQHKR